MDQAKVGLTISLLTRLALDLVPPMLEQDHSMLASWNTFLMTFVTIFNDPHWARTAEAALQRFHQASEPSTMYAARF